MTYFYFRQSQHNGEKQCLTFSHGARSWEKVATQYRISFKQLHTCPQYVQSSSLSLSLYISHSRAGNQRGVACCDGNAWVPLEIYKKIKLCWAPAFLSGPPPPSTAYTSDKRAECSIRFLRALQGTSTELPPVETCEWQLFSRQCYCQC